MSPKARSIFNDQSKMLHIQQLEKMYVPEFMELIMEKFTKTRDEQCDILHFVPSLGAAHVAYDLFKLVPPQIILALQNQIVDSSANITRQKFMIDYSRQPICRTFKVGNFTS